MKRNTYIDKALFNANTDFALSHNIDGYVILKLNYITHSGNHGHFNVRLDAMMESWTIQDFKKFNEILTISNDVYNSALFVHEYIVQVVNELIKEKADLVGSHFVNDRKKIDDLVNRFIKFNQVLSDSYGIESIEIENATPKYKKCIVYSVIHVEGVMQIKTFDGLQFEYKGHTLQVYANEYKKKHIIIPSCGQSIGNYDGQLKVAHEYLQNIGFIDDPNNRDKIDYAEKIFRDLMTESGIEIPEVCKSIVKKDAIDLVNDTIEQKEVIDCNIKRFSRRFGNIYNDLYDCESSGLDIDYTDKVTLFDSNMEVLKPILSAFTSFRGDFISSDRESAAFIMTLEYYIERGYDTIAGIAIPESSVESVNECIESSNEVVNDCIDNVNDCIEVVIESSNCIESIPGPVADTSIYTSIELSAIGSGGSDYNSIMADKIRGSPII